MSQYPGLSQLRLARWFALGSSGLLMVTSKPALAEAPLQFQAEFMRQAPGQPIDVGASALSVLNVDNDLVPGRYRVEIQVNLAPFDEREIEFTSGPDGLVACLSGSLLQEMGLKSSSLAEPSSLQQKCVDLAALVPGAQADFDGSRLLLSISIPQIAMRRDVAGHVDPARWDHGINAAFISYQASAQQSSGRGRNSDNSQDLYLNSGVNLGHWRLRSNQSLREDENGKRDWSRAYAYAQRDLPGLQANLTLGETFTGSDVFRSLPFKGALVASDLGMLPDVMQGYAPVIRGVAQTRAKLEILQNGYPIYSTYVSPGPYVIDDLGIAGGGGELEVVLTEADGQVNRYTQPYATLGNLLREGVWRYSAALGRYNGAEHLDSPPLWQATLARGGFWNSTLYGGLLGSDFYRAITLGAARDFGSLGAVSVDMTQSAAEIDSASHADISGSSLSARYGKSFASRTNLRFAGYRYSTEGYRDFDEAVNQRNRSTNFRGGRRSRLEASVYQNIGSRSAVSLTLSQDDYWNSNYQRRQYQLQFNTQYRGVSYNLFASQSLNAKNNSNRLLGLSVSMPLGFGHANTATFDFHKEAGRNRQRASLNGSIDQGRLNYQASLSNAAGGQQSGALSLGYQGPFAAVGGGYTQARDYNSLSLNASGAALLHADGVEFGPYLGETSALVEVGDIPGIGIANTTSVRTNSRGYALVPQLRPYRVNSLSLETDQLGPDIEIDNGTTQVVPRRGAVVKAQFSARPVTRLVITGLQPDGKPLPFGAQISDRDGKVLGVVGPAGQALIATDKQVQTLDVRFGGQHCQLAVEPSAIEQDQGYRLQTLTCRLPAASLPVQEIDV